MLPIISRVVIICHPSGYYPLALSVKGLSKLCLNKVLYINMLIIIIIITIFIDLINFAFAASRLLGFSFLSYLTSFN